MLESSLRRPAAPVAGVLLTASCLFGLALFAPHVRAEPVKAPTAESSTTLLIPQGSHKVLDFKGLERVAVGDPGIVDVHTAGKGEVVLDGVSPGKTSLIIWTSGGKRLEYALVVEK